MGFLDKLKSKLSQDDDAEDDLDGDAAPDDDDGDGEDEPGASSGGGALGLAVGFLGRVKKLSSGGEGDDGGGIGALLGKAKGLIGAKKNSDDPDMDDDDDTGLNERGTRDADQDDEDGEQPIRRSGIAAALDGGSGGAAATEEKDEDGEPEIPVAVGSGGGAAAMDLGSLFEEEFVANPILKDLAESVDEVSAVDLAADLRSFLEELQ